MLSDISPRKVFYETIRDYWGKQWEENRAVGYCFKVDFVKNAMFMTLNHLRSWQRKNLERLANQDGQT